MSSSERVRFGLKWVGASMVLTQAVRFLVTLILARLLVPEAFGLVAMTTVTLQVVGILGDIGFGSAYVQRRYSSADEAELAASTIFVVLAVIHGSLFLLGWSSAPLVAEFFESDALEPVVRWMFLSLLLEIFITTPRVVLERKLEFGKQATCEMVASATNAAVAVPMAFAGFGVWSFVGGQLASQLAHAVSLVWISGWRPRLRYSRRLGREFFAYGRFLWAFAILTVVGDSLDRAIVGRWLGPATLGAYTLAYNLSRFVPTFLTRIVSRIAFPAFSQVQTDPTALRSGLSKALGHVSFVVVPLAFGMLAVSEELIVTLYGEKWLAAVPVIEVLAFYGMTLAVAAVTGPIFRAIGRPQVLLYTRLLHQILLVVLLFALRRYGVVGIAHAVLAPMLVSAAIAFWLSAAYVRVPLGALLAPLARCGLASLAMYAVLRFASGWLDGTLALPPAASLAILVVTGVAAYLAASALVNRDVLAQFSATAREVVLARGELT